MITTIYEEIEMSEENLDGEGGVAIEEAPPKKSNKKTSSPKKAASKPAAKAVSKPTKNLNEDNSFVTASKESLTYVATTFRMLGDATRLKILGVIDGELTVDDLAGITQQSQPAVSHHLALLRNSRLVLANRNGKTVLYTTTKTGATLLKIAKGVLASEEEE
jgi:ArsR family transcriptional regulator, zinc-responsive transcriptional repressor